MNISDSDNGKEMKTEKEMKIEKEIKKVHTFELENGTTVHYSSSLDNSNRKQRYEEWKPHLSDLKNWSLRRELRSRMIRHKMQDMDEVLINEMCSLSIFR